MMHQTKDPPVWGQFPAPACPLAVPRHPLARGSAIAPLPHLPQKLPPALHPSAFHVFLRILYCINWDPSPSPAHRPSAHRARARPPAARRPPPRARRPPPAARRPPPAAACCPPAASSPAPLLGSSIPGGPTLSLYCSSPGIAANGIPRPACPPARSPPRSPLPAPRSPLPLPSLGSPGGPTLLYCSSLGFRNASASLHLTKIPPAARQPASAPLRLQPRHWRCVFFHPSLCF
ncbi:hypothetical protein B0H14DRAFT_3483040 [Mycena olivaceomarginata]|nr:hypothetical protein B0H14DRAFT_3483040 [Mycena olivaceomarginata]